MRETPARGRREERRRCGCHSSTCTPPDVGVADGVDCAADDITAMKNRCDSLVARVECSIGNALATATATATVCNDYLRVSRMCISEEPSLIIMKNLHYIQLYEQDSGAHPRLTVLRLRVRLAARRPTINGNRKTKSNQIYS